MEAKKDKESQKTKGQGVYHFSNQTSKLLSILTLKKRKYVEVNHKFGEGTSPKLRKMRIGIDCLIDYTKSNIQLETFFAHSMQRKNYIFFHEKNILKKIIDQKKNFSNISSSRAENITSAWIKRWLLKRINRRETLEKLLLLGPEYIHKQLYFADHDNVIDIKKSR